VEEVTAAREVESGISETPGQATRAAAASGLSEAQVAEFAARFQRSRSFWANCWNTDIAGSWKARSCEFYFGGGEARIYRKMIEGRTRWKKYVPLRAPY